MTDTETLAIQYGMNVVANVGGRHVTGRVAWTAHQGTELLNIGFYSPELGHVNWINDAIAVKAADIVSPASAALTEVATIDIVELTEMFGEPADQQSAVAEWTGEDGIWERWSGEPQPRWTPAEAEQLLHAWKGEQPL